MPLSRAARDRIDSAWAEVHGLAALAELSALVNPGGTLGRWAVAGELAARLRRFDGAAYARISQGYRAPHDRIEALMMAVLRASLPTSRRRLFDLLN
jgi:hypothetical protein